MVVAWSHPAIFFIVAISFLSWFRSTAAEIPESTPFVVGQVWSYHTRTGEEASTLQIVRIDKNVGAANTIHISIDGLKIPSVRNKGSYVGTMSHVPITEAALRESVISVIRVDSKLRDYQEGYKAWVSAKGGVFSIPVSEIVSFVEETTVHGKRKRA